MRIGDALPVFERELALPDLVAYGAATWDWHPMHYDRALAVETGLREPIVDGQMLGALMAKQILDWLGPAAFITHLEFRFRSPVFAGERVRCEGEVLEVEKKAIGIAQRIVVEERLAAEGSARVRI